MLKKLRLDQTKVYEKHLALEELSNMLLAFVNMRPHHLAIGAEQGNIDKWDDFVIRKHGGGNIYIQAKRQTTDFSSSPIERGYKRKPIDNEPMDLSELDNVFESLGKWINSSGFDLKHEFRLVVLSEGSIKKGLEIRHLKTLLEQHVTSVTTATDLMNLADQDKDAKNIFDWLTTWCGFKAWDDILYLMRVLNIITTGSESEIEFRADNQLKQIFISSEVGRIRSLILSYIDDNTTFAGAMGPRQLLYQLQDYLLPTIPKWTLFKNNGSAWNISGIHDLEDNTEIERPSIMVPALWSKDNSNARWLGIDGACIEDCSVSQSLMRLSLHPYGSFDTICSDISSWQNSIKIKIGGTLGAAKDDLDNMRISDRLDAASPTEIKELATLDEQEQFAKELHNEMYKTGFEYVNNETSKKIRNMASGDLRTEVEKRWNTWKPLLENNIDEQKKLFTKILHPQAEGQSISGELRVGPRTAELLAETIFLLLVVSVCLGDDKNRSWKTVKDQLKVNSIGLAYWSGPAEGVKKIIEIDDDEGIGKLLEKEPGQILIIPQSKLPETYAFNDDIFGGFKKGCLLSHPRYPKLLITQDWEFKRKLNSGSISNLREYLQERLDKYENNIQLEAEKIAEGVMV